MHHYEPLKTSCVKISAWEVRMTSRSEKQQDKLENIATLQIFCLLIYLKPVNFKLKIMWTGLRIPREKLKLDNAVITNTNQLVNLSYCFCIIYIKTQTIQCILNLDIFGFTFSIFPSLLYGTQWGIYSL